MPAHGKALVKTDLSIAIPVGTYARVGEFSHSSTTPTTMLVKCLHSAMELVHYASIFCQ